MPILHSCLGRAIAAQPPLRAVPFPCVSEHAVAVVTAKQDDPTSFQIRSERGVVARRRAGRRQQCPAAIPIYRCIGDSLFSVPPAEPDHTVAGGISSGRAVVTTGG